MNPAGPTDGGITVNNVHSVKQLHPLDRALSFHTAVPPATPTHPHLGFVLDDLIDATDTAVVVDPVHEQVRVPVGDAVGAEVGHGQPAHEQDDHEEDIRAASVGPAFDVLRGNELNNKIKTPQDTGEGGLGARST